MNVEQWNNHVSSMDYLISEQLNIQYSKVECVAIQWELFKCLDVAGGYRKEKF